MSEMNPPSTIDNPLRFSIRCGFSHSLNGSTKVCTQIHFLAALLDGPGVCERVTIRGTGRPFVKTGHRCSVSVLEGIVAALTAHDAPCSLDTFTNGGRQIT